MTPLPYPALHATHGGIWIAWPDGRTEALGRGSSEDGEGESSETLASGPFLIRAFRVLGPPWAGATVWPPAWPPPADTRVSSRPS